MGLAGVAAGQFGQLGLAGASVPQLGHLGAGVAVLDLLGHLEVVVGGGGHQGLVGDAKNLPGGGQLLQKGGHGATDAAADAAVDFVEEQGDMGVGGGQTGLEGQQKTAHLTAGGHLGQRRQGLAGIGRKQEAHRIAALLRGGGGLQLHRKAHMGQPHRPQRLHQLLFEAAGGDGPGGAQGAVGLVALLTGGDFPLF